VDEGMIVTVDIARKASHSAVGDVIVEAAVVTMMGCDRPMMLPFFTTKSQRRQKIEVQNK